MFRFEVIKNTFSIRFVFVKSFIDDIAYDYKAKQIVKTIIDFGKIMSIQIVAEGVEDEIIENYVKGLKIGYGQGYYFGKPLPPENYNL